MTTKLRVIAVTGRLCMRHRLAQKTALFAVYSIAARGFRRKRALLCEASSREPIDNHSKLPRVQVLPVTPEYLQLSSNYPLLSKHSPSNYKQLGLQVEFRA